MPPNICQFSRRRLIGTLGLSAAIIALSGRNLGRAGAAPTAPMADGFQLMHARTGSARLRGVDQPATPIWGYAGVTPGPLLRAKRGEELKVRLVNELSEPTVVHWHGVRLPNAMDGVPHLTQPPIAPGASFDYRFSAPDAGTFWYHAHLYSSEQMDRGLYGALIIDELEKVDVDRDVLLVFDDWRLNADGTIHETSFRSMHDAAHDGRLGNHFTANGVPDFEIAVRSNERIRLRLVNAANARIMSLRLDRHRATVMAIDGQPAEPFVARDGRVTLGPGNRVDLFVDALLEPSATAPIVIDSGSDERALARLVYDSGAPARAAPRSTDPRPLPPNPLPLRMDFAGALKLDVPIEGGAMAMTGAMSGRTGPTTGPTSGMLRDGFDGAAVWSLAGRASDGHSGKPLFAVKRGRTVMLALANRTAFPHAMHVHGHHFRLLDRLDDGWKPFWLDTVVVPARETWRIAFVADNRGKWMLHCHMLEHLETGMAAWFEVI